MNRGCSLEPKQDPCNPCEEPVLSPKGIHFHQQSRKRRLCQTSRVPEIRDPLKKIGLTIIYNRRTLCFSALDSSQYL